MNLIIKGETLPCRCEICHQSDLFDPVNNRCSRCAGVKIPINKVQVVGNSLSARIFEVVKATAVFGGVAGLGVGLFGLLGIALGNFQSQGGLSLIVYGFLFLVLACIIGILSGGAFGLIFGIVAAAVLTPINAALDQLSYLFKKIQRRGL